MAEPLMRFLESGGVVLVLLSALGAVMFASAILRALTLRRGFRGPPDAVWVHATRPGVLPLGARLLMDEGRRSLRRLDFARLRAGLRRFRRLLRLSSATAPLLGLLGTVRGMGQTFAALGTNPNSARVADGIAEALVTTELGLAMALPGLALGAWLDRKEERLQQELEWLETWTNAEGSNGE